MTEFWLTKSDGIVTRIGERQYSNAGFVSAISEDDSSMGKLMGSRFPTETLITTMNDDIPKHWIPWSNAPLDIPAVDKIMVLFDEVPSEDRLHTTRGTISLRTREVMTQAKMSVTPRGIKDTMNATTVSPEEVMASIVHGIYHLVEKNTLASMKSTNAPLSASKRMRLSAVNDIVSQRLNIIDVAMLSSYVEPSPTLMSRSYYLGTVYGMGIVNTVINDVYYRTYYRQVDSIRQCWQSLSK